MQGYLPTWFAEGAFGAARVTYSAILLDTAPSAYAKCHSRSVDYAATVAGTREVVQHEA